MNCEQWQEDSSSPDSFGESGLFDSDKIMTIFRKNDSGIDVSTQLWSLLVFALWQERFKVT